MSRRNSERSRARAFDETAAPDETLEGERIAKRLARIGVASRRDAERMIEQGRIAVNGRTLDTPATLVTSNDRIELDGDVLPAPERTRLWLLHKPAGLVTTAHDPEGRPTVFEALPDDMPRVISVGRLDINTEGLLLLTNDGGLARVLELPSTGWLRRYRVRAHGRVRQAELDELRHGMAVDGVFYGAIEAELEREQGSNMWLTLGLREGKNREVKNVLGALGLEVNRLIRVSYGPFQLGELEPGAVREIRGRALREQLGARLIEAAGADFEAEVRPKAVGSRRSGQRSEADSERETAETRRPVKKRGDWVSGADSPFQRPKGARGRSDARDAGERSDSRAHADRGERASKRKVWDEEGRPYRMREDGGSDGRRLPTRRPDDRSPKKHMWRAPDATPGRGSSGDVGDGGGSRGNAFRDNARDQDARGFGRGDPASRDFAQGANGRGDRRSERAPNEGRGERNDRRRKDDQRKDYHRNDRRGGDGFGRSRDGDRSPNGPRDDAFASDERGGTKPRGSRRDGPKRADAAQQRSTGSTGGARSARNSAPRLSKPKRAPESSEPREGGRSKPAARGANAGGSKGRERSQTPKPRSGPRDTSPRDRSKGRRPGDRGGPRGSR